MSSSFGEHLTIPFFKSTFFRATFIVAVCILAVVTTTELVAIDRTRDTIRDWVRLRGSEATTGVAQQVAGAIKFGRADNVEEELARFSENIGEDLTGAIAIGQDGTPVALSDHGGFARDAAIALGMAAIESGQAKRDPEMFIQAAPARFGQQGEVVGAFVSQWTVQPRFDQLTRGLWVSFVIAGGVFAAALAGAAGLFYHYISRPLRQVARQVGEVAAGDYDQEIFGQARSDEIGRIAGNLAALRDGLSAARETQTENAFKSAAISGTGAALILLDAKRRIAFANEAACRLLNAASDHLRETWQGYSCDALPGSPVERLPGMEVLCHAVTTGASGGRAEREMIWGEARIRASLDTVCDAEGEIIGYVLEMQDVSMERLNAAVLDAIDTHQVRIDFDAGRRVMSCNDKFVEMVSLPSEEILGTDGPSMLRSIGMSEEARQEQLARITRGQATTGKFSVNLAGGANHYVEGSINPIIGNTGEVERIVFIGNDITRDYSAMLQASEAQKETAAEQDTVVEGLKEALRRLADGDLTCVIGKPFPPKYEQLRSNFNMAVTALHDAISAVVQNAESIRSETDEISKAADDLASRTEKQASTLEQTAAALDQLTASVKSAATGADDASEIALSAQSKAQTGGEVARRAVTAMDAIRESSREISKITNVIDDIAFQTNLLALNAGVEAARAGDAGRGFAVVATEVRALAQRSSEAAREINELISASGSQVKSGVDLVDQTGAALDEIVTAVVDISSRVTTIATSAREQSAGLNEINSAMNELDQVTQQNAAMFEETTAASHALTSEANALVDASGKFRVKGAGQPGRGRDSRPTARPAAMVANGDGKAMPGDAGKPVSWEEF